jgi:hypothetical protein
MKDPTTNGIEGWSQGKRAPQGIGGIRKKDIYMRFPVRRSWTMQSELSMGYGKLGNGTCGGVDPLQNEKETTDRGRTGNIEVLASPARVNEE